MKKIFLILFLTLISASCASAKPPVPQSLTNNVLESNFVTNITGEDTQLPYYNTYNVDNKLSGNIVLLAPNWGGDNVLSTESGSQFGTGDFHIRAADSGSGYITSLSIGNAGTGYAIDDRVSIYGNSGTGWGNAVIRITSVSSGAVTGFVLEWAGSQYVVGNANPTINIKTSGSGLTFNILGVGTFSNAKGSDIIISTGASTGLSESDFVVNTVTPSASGTSIIQPTEKLRVYGSGVQITGSLKISNVTPGSSAGVSACIGSDNKLCKCGQCN